MVGSGFPSTGQVKETELQRDTLVLRPLAVADGESEKKTTTTQQKMKRYSDHHDTTTWLCFLLLLLLLLLIGIGLR